MIKRSKDAHEVKHPSRPVLWIQPRYEHHAQVVSRSHVKQIKEQISPIDMREDLVLPPALPLYRRRVPRYLMIFVIMKVPVFVDGLQLVKYLGPGKVLRGRIGEVDTGLRHGRSAADE